MYDLGGYWGSATNEGIHETHFTLLGVVVVLALIVPAAAMAGSSTCQGYDPQTCGPVTQTTHGDDDYLRPVGTLPFTGLDVVLLVVGGGTLLGAGFVVRRLSRRLD